MSEGSPNYASTDLMEMIKIIMDTGGARDLSGDIYNELSDLVTFLLKLIVQQSLKFMDKNNHLKLTMEDIRFGMKSMGVEPVFSFISRDPALFKHGRGGNKGCFGSDDKELDLAEVIKAPVPKIPIPCSIKGHWLAIEGIQPSIPENPVPDVSKARTEDDVKPKAKSNQAEKSQTNEVIAFPMSLEQQHYLQEITEACVGTDENRRTEAFESLKVDTGLGVMLPRLCNFIFEGVRVNVGRNNFAMLIYLMRMCKSLVDNSNLRLEAYLHELLPPIVTCIVNRHLCSRPDVDNHWALREYAARLLCQVCRTFSTGGNQLRSTVTKLLSSTLVKEETPMTTLYGALFFLSELGVESVFNFVLPCVRTVSYRLFAVLGSEKRALRAYAVDKIAAERIQSLLLKILPPVILTVYPTNYPEDFEAEYGEFLGPPLYKEVLAYRQQQHIETSQNVTGQVPASIILGRNLTMGLHQGPPQNSSGRPYVPGYVLQGSFASSSSPTATPQKLVLISPQQRIAASSVGNTAQPSAPTTPQILRFVPGNP